VIKALLFDLDGTLIDSMPHHHEAWVQWHARRGVEMAAGDFFAATAGRSNAEILLDMYPQNSVDEHTVMADEKEAIYREFAANSLELIKGAQDFVERARAAGLRMAVCTASTVPNMALAFERYGIDRWVETVVSPADGLRGKPHPDIFLEAARRLGIATEECVVFEDAPLGVEGARRAGMKAVALTTTLSADAFDAYDNIIAIASDFTTIDLSALMASHCATPKNDHSKEGTP
jgi:HAD superfamily hydrolase (TIGR01509 family)